MQAEVQHIHTDGALSLHTRSLKYGKVDGTIAFNLFLLSLSLSHIFPFFSLSLSTSSSPFLSPSLSYPQAVSRNIGNCLSLAGKAVQKPLPQLVWSQYYSRQQWLRVDKHHCLLRKSARGIAFPGSLKSWIKLCGNSDQSKSNEN